MRALKLAAVLALYFLSPIAAGALAQALGLWEPSAAQAKASITQTE
jgi:uncharacterized membrane protein